MSISGLVVTLSEDPGTSELAMKLLTLDRRLCVGERFGRRVAVMAETPSVEADRSLWDELCTMPGVEFVDVAYVGLDDQATAHSPPLATPKEGTHAHR